LLAKEDGRVDWTRPAAHLALQVRAFDPWPGAYTFFKGQRLKLFGGRVGTGRGRPGQVLALDEGDLHVAAGEGSLRVAEFQLEGRKRQTALQFWHGQHLGQNMVFGS
jgi:methionyl-tRNA formyltransferase